MNTMYVQTELSMDRGAWVSSRAGRWGVAVFTITLVGNALAAYSIGPFPIAWFTQCLPLLFVVWQAILSQRLLRMPGLGLISLFLVWAAAVTIVQALTGNYTQLSPALMTVSYPVFLLLRFINVLAMAGQAYLTYWLLAHGRRDEVLQIVIVIGAAVALAALYIYVAQIVGWWEPPRTRIGTSGGEQAVVFSYAFHRAMGTFREPSHLAEWLIVPFFLTLLAPRLERCFAVVIALILLLTGSLTGILGAAIGFAAAAILLNPLRWQNVKAAVGLAAVVATSYLLFSTVAVAYSNGHADLLQVIQERIQPILDTGGLTETNRGVVYEYFSEVPIPVVGQGLGNANLALSNYLGTSAVASLLSLYYNVLYSAGYLGFALFLLFLLRPIAEAWRGVGAGRSLQRLLVFAAYCSWLVVFAVHAEEAPIMFGIIYGIACYEARFAKGDMSESI